MRNLGWRRTRNTAISSLMILRFEKRTVNVHLVTSSHTTTTRTVTTTIIDRTGSDSHIRVAQIGITVVLALFTITSHKTEFGWLPSQINRLVLNKHDCVVHTASNSSTISMVFGRPNSDHANEVLIVCNIIRQIKYIDNFF